jgi:hypothetical protein
LSPKALSLAPSGSSSCLSFPSHCGYKEAASINESGLPDGIFSGQKIAIWINFGCSCNGRCWYI